MFAAIALFIVIALVFIAVQYAKPAARGLAGNSITVGQAAFTVEIADTPAARAKGLSGHAPLADNQGMLFVFPFASPQIFWMKDMTFPIDIIWIKDNVVTGMVIGAETEPGPNYTLYKSSGSVDKVLEINAGLVSRLGIKTGDPVVFR